MKPINVFWQGCERQDEKKYKNVSTVAQVVFCWMINHGRRNDLKSLARTCRINAHIVKKFRWQFDKWCIRFEKDNLVYSKKKEQRKLQRYNDLQEKRYCAYEELIRLIEDPKHYKYNCRFSHYVDKNTIVGEWTIEQCLFTFGKKCGRLRQKWKDRGRIEHLHFYQYYRDLRHRDIHYYRSGKHICFIFHDVVAGRKKEYLQIDWPEHDECDRQSVTLE